MLRTQTEAGKSFVRFLVQNLGRCPTCIRKAFLAAACSSALAFPLGALAPDSWVATAALVAALTLTALWLAHIGALAVRLMIASKRSELAEAPAPLERRKFLADFARGAAVAITATTLAVKASTSLAQGRCDCSRCSSEQYCCPTAGGSCGCFPFPCPR